MHNQVTNIYLLGRTAQSDPFLVIEKHLSPIGICSAEKLTLEDGFNGAHQGQGTID